MLPATSHLVVYAAVWVGSIAVLTRPAATVFVVGYLAVAVVSYWFVEVILRLLASFRYGNLRYRVRQIVGLLMLGGLLAALAWLLAGLFERWWLFGLWWYAAKGARVVARWMNARVPAPGAFLGEPALDPAIEFGTTLGLVLQSATTDKAAAEAAVGVLYHRAGWATPSIRLWVRSARELAVVRPLVEGLLEGLVTGQAWRSAWFDVVSASRSEGRDPVYDEAAVHVMQQLAALEESGTTITGGPSLELDATARPLAARLAPFAPLPSRIRTGLRAYVQTAKERRQVIAYQLEKEGRLSATQVLETQAKAWERRLILSASMQFERETTGRTIPAEWVATYRLARATDGWVLLGGAALLLGRPVEIHDDPRDRPHRADGPALVFADGFMAWARDGVGLPREAIESPASMSVDFIRAASRGDVSRLAALIDVYGAERYAMEAGATAELIANEPNVVTRRRMIEAYGIGPYVAETGRVIHTDVDGLGEIRRLWTSSRINEDPLVVVEVANSTPEPDGSRHRYWLRVRPTARTCQEAVAWTFGIDTTEYRPLVET
jgi:uncharacterized protein DUF6745